MRVILVFIATDSDQKALAKQLVKRWNIHEGFSFIVDIDLKTFFDKVDKLLTSEPTSPKGKMPDNYAFNTQMVTSSNPNQW